MNFIPAILPEETNSSPVRAFLFHNGKEILTEQGNVPRLNPDDPLLEKGIYLGLYGDEPCYTARIVDSADRPNKWQWSEIRPLHAQLPEELYALIGYASQILTWRENHQFCSKCGANTKPSSTERTMVCTDCGFLSYPRISPSVIVAVTRGEELLMARSPHFPEGLYSIVAGFLEPGETLEQCVAREVMEETGIKIENIRYFANQPWPFPHSLMVGFTADYAGGEINIDPNEIEDAGWYAPEKMPPIPSESTIARWLIDDYLAARS